ncbi:MAG: hypothetical protein JFAIHJKO_02380 [Pyrinomonadaceae bacterium]|nr:hypothetical protein [Pyrinomonadaceae bacterium]
MFVWDDAKREKVIETHGVDLALILDVFLKIRLVSILKTRPIRAMRKYD